MWLYFNNDLTAPVEGDYGFVYEIINNVTGKKYIGKKFFWSRKTKQVKGKKKRYLAESDWKEYYGSNEELLKDVKELGQDKFTRTILKLCKSKGECSYFEAKFQFDLGVLENPTEFYNSWIMVRVHRKHLIKSKG
jgi:hypothetical protein